ncbi:recombinase family protein [Microbacterium enclense]|uniref:recombinase family protein n=1 Tax=Microbacterium enclense TaxID=993073 RepID=UPI003F7E8FE2
MSKDTSGSGRSPDQQHDDNVRAFNERGWLLHSDPYRDDDRSASRYARRAREDFLRLISDLRDDTFGADILVIWESSRGSRTVAEWVELLELLEQRRVKVFVTTHGRLYDPRNHRDRRSMLEDAVDSEYESAKISERLRRSAAANAEAGRPHGKNVYGYRRVYSDTTKALLRVEPDPSTAPIVQEAGRRVLRGETLYAIAKDFNERGIPPRRPHRSERRQSHGWTPVAVKQMLTTPAYAGLRQHRGLIVGDASWPPLIDRDKWESLQSIMSPIERRRTSNDWVVKHLLSGIAVCDICGAPLRVLKQNARGGDKYLAYVCSGVPGRTAFHVAMKAEYLDLIVTELVLARFEQADFLALLNDGEDDRSAEIIQIQEEIAGHHRWLERVRERAEAEHNLELLFDQQRRVEPKLRAAERRLTAIAPVDPVVWELLADGEVRSAWESESFTLAKKRQAIRAVVTPRVKPVGSGVIGKKGPNPDRVVAAWVQGAFRR